MSPSVITSVALAPRLRIDDTGLPTSTSRVSTVPRIGALIVALASSSSARSTAARACATFAVASATWARAMTSWPLAARWRFSACSSALFASSSCRLRDQLLLGELLRAFVVAPRERDVGRLRFDLVLLQLRDCAPRAPLRRPAGWREPREGVR